MDFLRMKALTEKALAHIERQFDQAERPEDLLPYHGHWHTSSVIRRADRIAGAVKRACPSLLSDWHWELSGIAAAFHDIVQNWETSPGQDDRVIRRRLTGRNEAASAEEAIRAMREFVGYSADDELLVEEAIHATVPGWDPRNNTVLQPNLFPDSPSVVRIVALADLAGAGMDGPECFLEEGARLFREDQIAMGTVIRSLSARSDISSKQEDYKERLLAWLRTQAGFVCGRQARLEEELGNWPEPAKQAVRELFCHFPASIAAAETVVQTYEQMDWWSIAQEIGYDISHLEQ